MSLGPYCCALGCRTEADVVIDHPEHGQRTVCEDHADGRPVIAYV